MNHPVDELFEQEFRAHFHIPDSIAIQLSNGEASSIDKLPHDLIYFMKEQFVARLIFPILSFLK